MAFPRLCTGRDHAANCGYYSLHLVRWSRIVIGVEALSWCPDDGIARAEDAPTLLLDLGVGEELVQPVHAVPEVENQKFSCSRFQPISRDVHHVTEIT